MSLTNLYKDFNEQVLIEYTAIKVALQNSFIGPCFQNCEVIFLHKLLYIVITLFHNNHMLIVTQKYCTFASDKQYCLRNLP